jgi:hypothetical protein
MKIQSSSSLLEIQGLPSLKSKRLKRFAIDASSRMHAWLGLWNPVRTLAFGAAYLRMNVVR